MICLHWLHNLNFKYLEYSLSKSIEEEACYCFLCCHC